MKPVGAGNRMHRLVWRSPPPRGPPGGGGRNDPEGGSSDPEGGSSDPLSLTPSVASGKVA